MPSAIAASEIPPPHSTSLRKPLIGLLVAYLFGSITALAIAIPPILIMVAALAFIGAAFIGFKKKPGGTLILLATASIGALNTHLTFRCPTPVDLITQMERPREYVELVGIVADEPTLTENPKQWAQTFPLKLEGFRRTAQWQKIRDTVTVRWSSSQAPIAVKYGDRWLFHGLLSADEDRSLIQAHLQTYTLYVVENQARFVSGNHGHPLVAWCLKMRGKCRQILGRGLEAYPEQAGLLKALLLGYRAELPEALYRDFSSTGTIHIFAISGAHVAVMSFLLLALLKALGISRPYWVLWLCPFLALYTITTGMAPSAIRACIMAVIFWSAGLFGRQPDSLSSLALAALLILGVAPEQIVDLGFIFSFATVVGLITLYPVILAPFRGTTDRDPWMLQPASAAGKILRQGLRRLASLMTVSLAAWLASAPCTAYFFNLFSPIALPANLVVVPTAFLVMLTGCLALVTGSAFAVTAEIFNHANRVFITLLMKSIGAAAAMPAGHFYVRSPAPWFVAAWYALLFVFLLARNTLRWIALSLIFVLAGTGFLLRPADRTTRMDLLDVGDGQALLIDAPGDHDWLVDTGPAYKAHRVIEHIRRQGINRLEVLVLTHADADHIGAAAEIIRHCHVGAIWYPGGQAKFPAKNDLFEEAAQQGIPIEPRLRGDRGSWSSGIEWEVLHPPAGGPLFRKANDGSLVMRMAKEAGSILIMGGANAVAESSMLQARIEPAATILIAGDHASSNTCSEAWIDAVNPAYVLISTGPNLNGAPSEQVLQRIETHHQSVLRTDMNGMLRIVFPERMTTAKNIMVSAQNSDPR